MTTEFTVTETRAHAFYFIPKNGPSNKFATVWQDGTLVLDGIWRSSEVQDLLEAIKTKLTSTKSGVAKS